MPADMPEDTPEDVETRSAEDYRNAKGDFNGYITWPQRTNVRSKVTDIPEEVLRRIEALEHRVDTLVGNCTRQTTVPHLPQPYP